MEGGKKRTSPVAMVICSNRFTSHTQSSEKWKWNPWSLPPADRGGRVDYNQYGWGNDTKLVKWTVRPWPTLSQNIAIRHLHMEQISSPLVHSGAAAMLLSRWIKKGIGELKVLFPKTWNIWPVGKKISHKYIIYIALSAQLAWLVAVVLSDVFWNNDCAWRFVQEMTHSSTAQLPEVLH